MHTKKPYRFIYAILLFISLCNIAGSYPLIADQVVENRFLLIAWLHLLFLGLYVPFIWIELQHKIIKPVWIFYGITVVFSEAFLLFPGLSYKLFSISAMWLLFMAYSAVFLSMSIVHLNYLIKSFKR